MSFENIRNTMASRKALLPPCRCELAELYYQWVAAHCAEAFSHPDHVLLNQAIILISGGYFRYKELAPQTCRYLMKPKEDHICLFPVFEEFMMKIKRLELELTPPQLYIPPPPVPPPPSPAAPEPAIAEFNGIFLGEYLEEVQEQEK